MDDDFFSELEAIVVLLGPKECLIPSAEGDVSRISYIKLLKLFDINLINFRSIFDSRMSWNATELW